MQREYFTTFIPASDKTDLLFATYFNDKSNLQYRERLNARTKGLDTSDISYRVVNYWENNGLIDVERGQEGKGWRKYSLIDAIWISLIVELRKFGLSIEALKTIKSQLTNGSNTFYPSAYPLLEFYTSYFLNFNESVGILVFEDFQVLIGTKTEIESTQMINGIRSHISIQLEHLIEKVINKRYANTRIDNKVELSKEEIILLIEMRTGNYKSITVKMKDGKIKMLEKEDNLTDYNIHKILSQSKYDSISLETENGKVVNVKKISKQKI